MNIPTVNFSNTFISFIPTDAIKAISCALNLDPLDIIFLPFLMSYPFFLILAPLKIPSFKVTSFLFK